MKNSTGILARALAERARRVKASRDFRTFIAYTKPDYQMNWHHALLAERLQAFAEGRIKKLMVFMPPQHGKSELVSRRLPAFILGLKPDTKIIGCSYSADLATSFNRDVQRIIDTPEYANVFPNTLLNSSNVRTAATGNFLRNADIFEIVGRKGFYKSVGIGGSLTGTPADIGIIDDPVKDAVEAGSPTYRARAWDWFTNVFATRLHNDSQILVTQTRWHEDDLSGRILSRMNGWEVLSLPAICTGEHEHDPRKTGEALWPEKHSLERLHEIRQSNERAFHALYQQDPRPFEGGLVFPKWVYGFEERGRRAFGLDFGHSPDPLCLVEVYIHGNNLYIRQHIYRTNMSASDIVEAVKCVVPSGVEVFCDHRADIIQDMYRKGINAKPAEKGPNSIDYGVKIVQGFNIHIDRQSHDIARELKAYSYKQDKDGNPIGGAYSEDMNHAIDAIRYAVAGLVRNPSTRAESVAGIRAKTPK